ncbi:DUF4292 domain-containing protein [Flavobacterium sp. Sd200]|uniref:DUF4292 domain-containing protein n=1 Tax=Flavobacterium sp. Sd200 TaxID=2692211 RepID=UPI00136905F2|nr:DUF4292 domain-containing protein [Flavobacterium sp. Sd200]MXN92622.1 DUF4292 domain-containing protein [Flavobacterium sp. Sd200]
MKKTITLLLTLTLLASCKSKQAVVAEQAAEGSKQVTEIVEGHYKTARKFETLLIKSNARYQDKNTTQNVTAEIRIKKDEAILVSIRFLGITMAKALITPKEVSYYEKLNSTYFKGDYAVLSRWLGTDLDYKKVENMLVGEALDDLSKGVYKASLQDGKYKLTGKESGSTIKEYLFEGANYLLKKQLITQGGAQARSLDVQYPSHNEYQQAILPSAIKIVAEQKDTVNINIEYTSVKFDEKLTFPYEVPEGFEQIFIE